MILLRRKGRQVLEKVRGMLSRLGLELHKDKTCVVTAEKGFDFLGVHFSLEPVRKKGSRLSKSCQRWPADRSIQRIRQRIREIIGRRYSLSLEVMIKELNPAIRGWNNISYEGDACPEKAFASQLVRVGPVTNIPEAEIQ